MRRNSAFTLVEIIIVVVILGIMASIAIPRVIGPNERIKASEGQHTLIAIMGAQKNYFLENSAYATGMGSLDITIPASSYFNAPDLSSASAAALATVTSTAGTYVLSIDTAGVITCTDGTISCATIKCNIGGNRCN